MSPIASRTIDARRTSAGSMTVGLSSEGNITEIFTVGDKRLLMIKEHATYEIKMADSIDPERTNESLPNIQQRIFSAGSSSELVQKVLITSKELFNSTYLGNIKCESLSEHAINAMSEILAMDRIFERLRVHENALIEDLKHAPLENGFIVPSLEDVHQDVKNFLQRADHFIREINYITRIFQKGYGTWDNLIKLVQKENPKDDSYLEFLNSSIKYIKFIRECRNSVEHPLPNKRVNVYNFELDSDGNIITPSVEFIHHKFAEPRTRLLEFLEGNIHSLASLYAAWVAHLCARKAASGDFGVTVITITKEKRRYPSLLYSYAVPF
jgi:hypothetical protein